MGHTTKLPIRCPQNKGNHKPTQYIVCTLTYLLNQDKSVDSWIDELDPCETSNLNTIATSQDLTNASLLQQNLPHTKILLFNGSPFAWVVFVTKLKDIVQDQSYLNNTQKLHSLQQHVTGEARRAIHGLSNDKTRSVLYLKRLKYTFGQRSRIAQPHLAKITRGNQISKDDNKGLLEFYSSVKWSHLGQISNFKKIDPGQL